MPTVKATSIGRVSTTLRQNPITSIGKIITCYLDTGIRSCWGDVLCTRGNIADSYSPSERQRGQLGAGKIARSTSSPVALIRLGARGWRIRWANRDLARWTLSRAFKWLGGLPGLGNERCFSSIQGDERSTIWSWVSLANMLVPFLPLIRLLLVLLETWKRRQLAWSKSAQAQQPGSAWPCWPKYHWRLWNALYPQVSPQLWDSLVLPTPSSLPEHP